MLNKITWLTAFSTLVLLSATVQAQSDAAKDALLESLNQAKATTINGTVSLSEDRPKAAGNGGVKMAMAMMGGMGGGGTARPLFQGDVELYVKDGMVAAASVGELPQIKFFYGDGQKLFTQTHKGQAVDTGLAGLLIARAFKMDSLIEEVGRAKRVRVSDTDDGKSYRVTLDGDYFADEVVDVGGDATQKAMAMAAGILSESVLEAVLFVEVNSGSQVSAMRLEVQYNDPLSGIVAQSMKAKRDGKQPGAADLLGKKSTNLGKKVVLEFKASSQTSAVAKAFAEEAVGILK